MAYLTFEKIEKYNAYKIYNDKGQRLGTIEKIRVGQWLSWCLTGIEFVDTYFSASCLDEIRAKMKHSNRLKSVVSQKISLRFALNS